MNRYISETFGGAVFTYGNCEVLSCSFKKNKATYSGGSMYIAGKKIIIRSSSVENNTAEIGGAVHAEFNAVVRIFNCSFKGNTATRSGGAIYSIGKMLILTSSLFEHNTAASKYANGGIGGALFVKTITKHADLSSKRTVLIPQISVLSISFSTAHFEQIWPNQKVVLFTQIKSS